MTKAALAPTESGVIAAQQAEIRSLKELVGQLQYQVDWFRRRLFGSTSEKRILPEEQTQEDLLALLGKEMPAPPAPETETITYERKKRCKQRDNAVNDSGLRFDDTVPVETIHLPLSPEYRETKVFTNRESG